MKTEMTQTRTMNGVDVAQLMENIELIKANPTLADFNFRLTNKWIDCGLNRSTVASFHGVGEEINHEKRFVMDADEPTVLLGGDQGPNPVEYLLKAITACVTTSIVYHSAAQGIKIEALESSVDGDIDLRGFLGISDDVRSGYQAIRMNFRIKSDATEEQMAMMFSKFPGLSPVFNSITQGVPVQVNVDRM